jgi:diguanylate cyclase (GGDEF)-like protein
VSEDKTVIANIANFTIVPTKKKGTACLVQYNGSALGKRYPLDGKSFTLGRSTNAHITIGEASVSREHARLTIVDDKVSVEDLGSANGTFINDKKLTKPTNLADQDLLRLGTVLLKFFGSQNIDGLIQDRMYQRATIDAGTQIFNKQYLMDALSESFSSFKGTGRPLSIIYYDLDHFKKVNDTYGHNAGDQILKESAGLVKGLIRKDDTLGRFGGEEFIIIMPNTQHREALALAEKLRATAESHIYQIEGNHAGERNIVAHRQTISIGVAEAEKAMANPKELLETADKKLYHSKKNGRNRVTG